MRIISNNMVKKLLTSNVYGGTLNIMYENSMTKNYYISEDKAKLIVRYTPHEKITTLAIALFDEYNQEHLHYIRKSIEEYYNSDNLLTVQLYYGDLLVDEFKKLNFKTDLILRDHIRIENEFYTIISLSKWEQEQC